MDIVEISVPVYLIASKCSRSLDDCGLPQRIVNRLFEFNVKTLDELATTSTNALTGAGQFGPKSILSIQRVLASAGLSLSHDYTPLRRVSFEESRTRSMLLAERKLQAKLLKRS
jgi:DNA-directed RNA polymerase alpha subunit